LIYFGSINLNDCKFALEFGQWVEACPNLSGNLYLPRLCLLPLSGVFFFMATYFVLNIENESNQELEVFLNSKDCIYIGTKEKDPDFHQSIDFPILDWPEIKKYIDRLYDEFITENLCNNG
jgi:hypothetical protein